MEKIHKITIDTKDKMFLIDKIGNIEWGAGKYLSKRILSKDLSKEDVVFVITDSKDDLIGVAAFTKKDIAKENIYGPYLSTMFVSNEYRGKGFSLKLVDLVIEEAKKQGTKKLYIMTRLNGLYEKKGFSQIDEIEDFSGRKMRLLMRDL